MPSRPTTSPMGKIIPIWTEKGGVGKSVFSVNFAQHLANPFSGVKGSWVFNTEETREKQEEVIRQYWAPKVCFIDGDTSQSAFKMIGQRPKDPDGTELPVQPNKTLSDWYTGTANLDEMLYPSSVFGDMLPCIAADDRIGSSKFVVNHIINNAALTTLLFNQLRERFDYIVVDNQGKALDGFTKEVLALADGIFMVTTPKPNDTDVFQKSLADLKKEFGPKVFDRVLGLVLNMASVKQEDDAKILEVLKSFIGQDKIYCAIPNSAYQQRAAKWGASLFEYARHTEPSKQILQVAYLVREHFEHASETAPERP